MTAVALSEIADQLRGVSYGKADVVDRPTDGYLPVLRANNITDSGLLFDDLVYVRAAKVSNKQKIKAGDIVIAASSGSIAVVGKAAQAVADIDAGFGAFCKVVRPSAKVDARYLGHFFRTSDYRQKMSTLAAGANINNLKNEHIDELIIPLPPLDEQKRIAAILDQADEVRRKRQRALDRLNQLGQANFNKMFGDPFAPNAGSVVQLANVAELINGDRSSNYPSGDDIKETGVLFLNTTNIKNGNLDLSKSQFITEEKFRSLSRGKLRRDDLVITLRGTLGQCALFDCEHQTGFINAQMMIIRATERVLPRFLAEYISFPSVQDRLKRSNTGSAVPQLTAAQFKEMPIVLPALSEQRKFVEAINLARSVHKIDVAYLNHLDALFASLQHRAFRGEL